MHPRVSLGALLAAAVGLGGAVARHGQPPTLSRNAGGTYTPLAGGSGGVNMGPHNFKRLVRRRAKNRVAARSRQLNRRVGW